MQTIVFNMNNSAFNKHVEAIALKTGYLLGDEVFSAGDTPLQIDYREQMTGYSSIKKAGFLKRFLKTNPKQADSFARAEESFIKAEKMKLDGTLMAQKKKLEKMLDEVWEQMIVDTENTIDEMGFMVLKPFVNENTFCYLHVSFSNMETYTEGAIKASELLQLLLIPEDISEQDAGTPELFLFGAEFLSDDYQKPVILNPADANARDENSIYLQHVVILPNLSNLSTSQLRQVRENLRQPGSAFRLTVDEWCSRCYESADNEERLSVFTNKLMPAANELQTFIDAEPVLHNDQPPLAPPVELWAGEIPVWQIWNYYHHFETFGEETWQKLQSIKDDPEYKNQRWPVLMIKTEKPIPASESSAPEEKAREILPTKKYLSVE